MPPLDPKEWIVQVKESLSLEHMPADEQQYWEKRSIYRVPAAVTVHHREAYQPQLVSFGPYHHNKDHPMEQHKHRALLHFLRRSRRPLQSILESLKKEEVLADLEASYEALDRKWKEDTGRFLQLLITDGCFMLEILRLKNGDVNDYAPNDPIFNNPYVVSVIRRDMLLLENQLPMLLLEELVTVCDRKKEEEYINRLILRFCCSNRENNRRMGKCLHVLDVFRKNRVQPHVGQGGEQGHPEQRGEDPLMLSTKNKKRKSKGVIPPATELREHGIQFKQRGTDGNDSLTDISFASGVLSLPKIMVDDDTESTFLNLIAFERFHVGAGQTPVEVGELDVGAGTEVTSYIYLMDCLIDRGQDVALLRNKGIIENYMESDEAAAKLFNKLAKDTILDKHSSLHHVIGKVVEYCEKSWPDWRANLMHTYFRNPWVILSVIGAFLLFGLTAIQTVYTVLGYKK